MESNFKITTTHHYPEIFSEELVEILVHLHKNLIKTGLELLSAKEKRSTKYR